MKGVRRRSAIRSVGFIFVMSGDGEEAATAGVDAKVNDREEMDRIPERVRLLEARIVVLEAEWNERKGKNDGDSRALAEFT